MPDEREALSGQGACVVVTAMYSVAAIPVNPAMRGLLSLRLASNFRRHVNVRYLLSAGIAVWLALCSLGPALGDERGTKPVRSLIEMRRENIVTQKWDLSCGAATLSIILTYYLGDPISEPEVIGEILKRADPARVRARKGFSLLDMKKFAETRGYAAEGYAQMALADLIEYAPAIVPLNFNQGFDHFMVFLGIHGDRVLLADPAWGNRTMQFRRFEAAWRKIAFVVRRPGGAAQSSQLDVRPELFAVPNELAVQNTISRSALSVPLPRVQ